MGGGLLQIVAIGVQDRTLNGPAPEITFFKIRHRPYSNFAIESIRQTACGIAGPGKTMTCTIARNGDLVHKAFLEIDIPEITVGANVALVPDYARHLIDEMSLKIGGQTIDTQYGRWLHIWNELSGTASHKAGDDRMVGNIAENLELNGRAVPGVAGDGTDASGALGKIAAHRVRVPFQFYFNRHPGLSLPLIALAYHEVTVEVRFQTMDKLFRKLVVAPYDATTDADDVHETTWNTSVAAAPTLDADAAADANKVILPTTFDASIWVDYIYLDSDERKRMAQQPHNYLIEKMQYVTYTPIRGESTKVDLTLNHPVKELVWTVTSPLNPAGVYSFPQLHSNWNGTATSGGTATHSITSVNNAIVNTTNDKRHNKVYYVGKNPVKEATLLLNGQERFSKRDGSYFDVAQAYSHHDVTPSSPGINVYSFALRPLQYQPSGSLNFSRIDSASLQLTMEDYTANSGTGKYYENSHVDVFALSMNSFKVTSGMGGLQFSN